MEVTSKKILYKCSVCGHEWTSYSKGLRTNCPKCYEQRHGKPMGQSPEFMAVMREARKKKQQPTENIVDYSLDNKEHEPPPEDKPKKGFLSKILDMDL